MKNITKKNEMAEKSFKLRFRFTAKPIIFQSSFFFFDS